MIWLITVSSALLTAISSALFAVAMYSVFPSPLMLTLTWIIALIIWPTTCCWLITYFNRLRGHLSWLIPAVVSTPMILWL